MVRKYTPRDRERDSLRRTIKMYDRASDDSEYRGRLSRRLHLDHYPDATLREHFRRNGEQMHYAYDKGLYKKEGLTR